MELRIIVHQKVFLPLSEQLVADGYKIKMEPEQRAITLFFEQPIDCFNFGRIYEQTKFNGTVRDTG